MKFPAIVGEPECVFVDVVNTGSVPIPYGTELWFPRPEGSAYEITPAEDALPIIALHGYARSPMLPGQHGLVDALSLTMSREPATTKEGT